MNFHLAAYSASLAAGPNLDMTAPADGVFGLRNNHLIFTEPKRLIAVAGIGALITRLRFADQMLRQLGIPHVWPLDVSATPSDVPAVYDLRERPMPLPMNEEVTLEASNSAAGPTQTNALLWIATPQWSQNLPFPGQRPPGQTTRLNVRATATITAGAAGTWGAEAAIVMEQDLLNGVYAVVGAHAFIATGVAFRFRFPDQPAVSGKQHRPGGLIQSAVANLPWPAQNGGLGEWGRFHTFTLPTVQSFGDAAGGTMELRLDLIYLGEDESLLGD